MRQIEKDVEKLRSILLTVLDQVDYKAGNCGVNEMVGAVLQPEIIVIAREVLEETRTDG